MAGLVRNGGASGSEDDDAAAVCAGTTRKRKRERESPSALRSGQVRRRSWQHQQRGQGSTWWCLQFCLPFVLLRSLFSAGGGTKSLALASRDESLVNWSGKYVTMAYQFCCFCCFLLG
jgi:hypothetical protein